MTGSIKKLSMIKGCRAFWVMLGLCLCVSACPRTYSGRAALSPQERALEQQAMEALGQGDRVAEARVWRTLLQTFPRGALVGRAHLRLGMLAYQRKAWREACAHFAAARKSRLLAQERKYVLFYFARALFHEKQYARLQALLAPIVKDLPEHQQKQAYPLLARAATKDNKLHLAFTWKRRWWAMLPEGAKKETLRKELLAYLPKLTIPQLQQMLSEARKPWSFPLDFAAYRLAQLLYNAEKYTIAARWLARLKAQISMQHSLYPRVTRMYDEVSGVRRPANAQIIGAILPLTGRAALIGQQVQHGIEMAIQDYPQVRVIYKDSASSPKQAAAAVHTLVTEHKAIAIFGPPMAATALAAARKAQRLGVPLFSITARAGFPALGSFIFRNNLTPSMMGRAVARYAFDTLKIRRLAVLYPSSKYGKLQARAFLDEIKKMQATLGGAMEYEHDTQDYTFPVKMLIGTTFANAHILRVSKARMKQMKPFERRRLRKKMEKMLLPLVSFEGLFVPAPSLVASQIAAHLAYFNVGLKRPSLANQHNMALFSQQDRFRKIQLLGNNGWYHKDLFKAGEQYVRGGVFCVRYFRGSYRPASQQFTQAYLQRYHKDPLHISAYAYDTMKILAHIAASGKVRTRARFREALLKVRDFDGPTGPMTIDTQGETHAPIKFVMAYKGKFRLHGTLR